MKLCKNCCFEVTVHTAKQDIEQPLDAPPGGQGVEEEGGVVALGLFRRGEESFIAAQRVPDGLAEMGIQPVPGRVGASGLEAVLHKDIIPKGNGFLPVLSQIVGPAFQQVDGLQHQHRVFPNRDAGIIVQHLLHRLSG